MERIPEANPSDRWTIESSARAGAPGHAEVTLRITNEAFGRTPDRVLHVDWPAGGELCDAQAKAVMLAAQSMYCLAQRMVDHAHELIEIGHSPE